MYFRHVDLIKGMIKEWNIVEQKNFVDYGKNNIPEIDFYYTKEECLQDKKVGFVLLSGVLGYLQDGIQVLEEYLKLGVEYVCVDSTAFFKDDSKEKIMLQHVPQSIYEAEYPIHIFEWKKFLEIIERNHYDFVFEWSRNGIPIYKGGFAETDYRGFLIKSRVK